MPVLSCAAPCTWVRHDAVAAVTASGAPPWQGCFPARRQRAPLTHGCSLRSAPGRKQSRGFLLPRSGTMPNANKIIIFDTTLRDGEQSPGASMNLAEKLQVAHALTELGVDVIEAGF